MMKLGYILRRHLFSGSGKEERGTGVLSHNRSYDDSSELSDRLVLLILSTPPLSGYTEE